MSNHAQFGFKEIQNIVVITDHNHGTKSVTNDVEYVLSEINQHLPLKDKLVIYQDSNGVFDGIHHINGTFQRFYPLRAIWINDAILQAPVVHFKLFSNGLNTSYCSTPKTSQIERDKAEK